MALKLLFASLFLFPPPINGGDNYDITKGSVSKWYAAFQDTSSASVLSKKDSVALQKPFSLSESADAQIAYMKNCYICHGADRTGGSGPSLYRLNNRVHYNYFKNIVTVGRAQMPGFRLLDSKTLIALYKYLSDLPVGQALLKPSVQNSPQKN